ncbi:MAG: DUF1080 domain-containing protein [Thermoguttaceae bacterium]|jgi:hypothetical protein|nr:DUF1080 domain-containing protein [Thermoguttaceae bacterium]
MNRRSFLAALPAGLSAAATCRRAFCLADEKPVRRYKPGPITPREPIKLFNGNDLSGFYSWNKETQYEDPLRVFRVTDGMLHVTGEGPFGGLITDREYRDYHLKFEYKWGERTWDKRADKTRDSGVLIHCQGPDGNWGPWVTSIEYQVIEGGTGDIILLSNGENYDGSNIEVTLEAEVTIAPNKQRIWTKGAERQTFNRGRINWFGRDPEWKDVLGFRGRNDVESPHGEWTLCEVIADGRDLRYFVNGVLVNEAFNASLDHGRLLIQTEGAEVFFRNMELHPLARNGGS